MSDLPRLETGENRAPRFGVPVWAGEWPVTADGTEFAVIEETEHGYRLRAGTRRSRVVPFRPCSLDVWTWVNGTEELELTDGG